MTSHPEPAGRRHAGTTVARPAGRRAATRAARLRRRPPAGRPSCVADCVHCGFCLPTCPTYVLWGEEMDSPARAHLPDGAGARGRADDRLDGRPLRRLPGLHGVRDRVPVRRAVRQADRGDPRPGRAQPRAPAAPSARCARRSSRCSPTRGGCGRCAVRCAPTRRTGLLDRLRRAACWSACRPHAGRDGVAAPRGSARADRLPEHSPRGRHARAAPSACCSAACSASSSPASTPRPRGCSPPRASTSSPPRPGLLRRADEHTGREPRRRARSPARWSTPSTAPASTDRGQRRRLRLDDEGVRRPARRRPGVRRRGPRLFADRVRDVAEFLVEHGTGRPAPPAAGDVAYHDACHLAHAQGVRSAAARAAARRSPGWSCARSPRREICCGSAGIYNLLNPEPARELGDRKAAQRRAPPAPSCWSPPTPAA